MVGELRNLIIGKKLKILLVLLGVGLGTSFLSYQIPIFADSDNDGFLDLVDNCPLDRNFDQRDFDLDNLGDVCDADDDNDGVEDDADMFDTEPTEWADSDSDSIGDNKDNDDDNDGISDSLDQFDLDPRDWADFDFDGLGSSKDNDDDNDGIIDSEDAEPILITEKLATKYLSEIQSCADMDDGTLRLICYSQFFGNLAEIEENNSYALELSITLAKMKTIDDCHFVSHQIGHVAFEETQDVSKSLQGMDGTMCRGGYFHGVLASYFHNIEESGESFPESPESICDSLIGSSNYQDCIHGLGHGFVHYFGEDLNSSLNLCHEMSFYQNILCRKGVMMQYTDNVLTREGISDKVISNLCDPKKLERMDYTECSMSIGTTLAFFTNHDFEKGNKSCNLIGNEETRNLCVKGLRLEIKDSEKYEVNPLTEEIREKFQPQKIIETSKTIDIRSPALVSDFQYIPKIGMISFSIDRGQYVILYIPQEFMIGKMAISVDGQIPNKLEVTKNVLGENIVMIRFVAKDPGIVLITPLNH